MSGWAPKRFWTAASVEPLPDGQFTVLLDGRQVRTPAKAQLIVPTRAMADAIAAEWQAQSEKITPATMPVTRSANAAIDKVAPQFADVAALIAAYGESDLLCYRATEPEGLQAREAAAWDPLLDWAATTYGARLAVTVGVTPVAQPMHAVVALSAAVKRLDAFRLTALHDLVAISGSLVIGLAAAAEVWPIAELWSHSRIDEDWQTDTWGADDDATETARHKENDFLHAHRFWRLTAGI